MYDLISFWLYHAVEKNHIILLLMFVAEKVLLLLVISLSDYCSRFIEKNVNYFNRCVTEKKQALVGASGKYLSTKTYAFSIFVSYFAEDLITTFFFHLKRFDNIHISIKPSCMGSKLFLERSHTQEVLPVLLCVRQMDGVCLDDRFGSDKLESLLIPYV